MMEPDDPYRSKTEGSQVDPVAAAETSSHLSSKPSSTSSVCTQVIDIDFRHFLDELKLFLTPSKIEKIKTTLCLPLEVSKTERSEEPAEELIQSMRDQGLVSPTDISAFIESLNACGLNYWSDKICQRFEKLQVKTRSTPSAEKTFDDLNSTNARKSYDYTASTSTPAFVAVKAKSFVQPSSETVKTDRNIDSLSEPAPREYQTPKAEAESGWGKFCVALEDLLTRRHALKLATVLGYSRSAIDEIERNENSSRTFVQLMEERNEISSTDISTLIEKLENETVQLKGVAANVKRAYQKHVHLTRIKEPLDRKDDPSSTSDPLLIKKEELKRLLRRKYKNMYSTIQPIPYVRGKCRIDKLFVRNSIEWLEETGGLMRKKEIWRPLKSYHDMFLNLEGNRLILDAEPGFGKSTLALQLAYEWCAAVDESPMKNVEMFILIRLRQLKDVSSIYSAIKKFLLPKDSELTEDDIQKILQVCRFSTVIVLDGFDEYPDQLKDGTDIKLILVEDMFPDCKVILTTRKSYLPPAYSPDTKRTRLVGFGTSSRDEYILKAVAGGDDEAAYRIKQYFKENPVPAELSQVPLFFAMIAHMTHESEHFQNLKTVTDFFRRMIACFLGHGKNKVAYNSKGQRRDFAQIHSELDKVAFEGISGYTRQMSWRREGIRDRVGHECYDEYVRIGILVEEEVFDDAAIDYQKEVSFYHKVFLEWHAAHCLVKEVTRPEVKFKPWPKRFDARNLLLAHPPVAEQEHLLECWDPNDLHYMYRFACGLDAVAAIKIIEHLSKGNYYTECTLMCIAEWSGGLENILSAVESLCSKGFSLAPEKSSLLQTSTMKLLEFASNRQISILKLELEHYISSPTFSEDKMHLRSDVSLPVLHSLRELGISENGKELTTEETDVILQYASKCSALKTLEFFDCLVPLNIQPECLSVLSSNNVRVRWSFDWILNLKAGVWQHKRTAAQMTFEDREKHAELVRRMAKKMQGGETEDKP